jgi:hypothetical protein
MEGPLQLAGGRARRLQVRRVEGQNGAQHDYDGPARRAAHKVVEAPHVPTAGLPSRHQGHSAVPERQTLMKDTAARTSRRPDERPMMKVHTSARAFRSV